MKRAFEQRVALVTGAAQGIGQAIAHTLEHRGATVHATDVDGEGLQRGMDGSGATLHVVDLADREAVHALIRDIEAASGPPDILVNAAGGVRGQVGRPIQEVSEDDWRTVFEANVDSAFWLAQAAAPLMCARGWGRIVFIASGAGLRPSLTGIQAYTASKHALVGLTRQLSQEFGRYGVTVNAVAPGFVLSNPSTQRQWESYGPEGQARLVQNIHTRRLGTPEDIAASVAFLSGPDAGWISGQVISVDGGRS